MPHGGGGDGGERSVALRADEADSAKGEGDQLELAGDCGFFPERCE